MKEPVRAMRDPVCGKEITPESAYDIVRYKERDYLVCCPLCKSAFLKDPAMFSYLCDLERLRRNTKKVNTEK